MTTDQQQTSTEAQFITSAGALAQQSLALAGASDIMTDAASVATPAASVIAGIVEGNTETIFNSGISLAVVILKLAGATTPAGWLALLPLAVEVVQYAAALGIDVPTDEEFTDAYNKFKKSGLIN